MDLRAFYGAFLQNIHVVISPVVIVVTITSVAQEFVLPSPIPVCTAGMWIFFT
jgi:hypothetical protein